jgi:glutamate dehydrogenase/leucine dehydrogenase
MLAGFERGFGFLPAVIGGVVAMDKLQCRFVADAASGPTTPEVSE